MVLITIRNSILELVYLAKENSTSISRGIVVTLSIFIAVSSFGYYKLAIWCLWWCILGILSSIGMGFGMHTFVLFLGPHIAAVTLAAHSCKTLSFPEPPYPNEIHCPTTFPEANIDDQVTFFNILRKVSLESFMWGLGTAIGELPPYLAARLKARSRNCAGDSHSLGVNGWELKLIQVITRVGFFGIVLFAAVPNPFFDVAGLASGIAQVPFWSFFGATMIGKAVIKVLIQSCFVVFIFHDNNMDLLLTHIQDKLRYYIPSLGDLNLHVILEDQRMAVLRKQVTDSQKTSTISIVFSWLISVIMFLFVVSVVRELDKQYRGRTNKINKGSKIKRKKN